MKLVSPGRFASLILAVFFLLGSAVEQEAMAQRNEAVLNKGKKPNAKKHWVWRDKRPSESGEGIEGIVALVTPIGNRANDAEMRVWLYVAPNPGENKLKLNEVYDLFLTDDKQVNSSKGRNNSFHYKLETPIIMANGERDPSRTRTFIITATRERGNLPRTLRVTTFTKPAPLVETNGENAPNGEKAPNGKAVQTRRTMGCIDYPDDAVLDEDEQSLVIIDDVLQPDPDDDWMTYP